MDLANVKRSPGKKETDIWIARGENGELTLKRMVYQMIKRL